MSKKFVDKLQYLNYDSIFSAKGDINLPLRSRACFADVLNRGEITNESYEMYLIRDPYYAESRGGSNLCFLTKEELKKHIYLARRLFPFKYNVIETDYKGFRAFKVQLKVSGKHIYHRYLLTWIRYAYEFPFNIILNEALRMKHCFLKKETVSNLFVLCANCSNRTPEYYNTGHSISEQSSKFMKEKDIKEKLLSLSINKSYYGGQVNDIYPRVKGISGLMGLAVSVEHEKDSKCLDYWADSEEFEKRSKVYLKAYKQLKKS